MLSSELRERVRRLGPVFRARDARAAGLSWRVLYELRDAGEVIAVSRGVYQLTELAGAGEVDFVAVCQRAPHATICLNSALAYWDLTDENPAQVHLAVPRGSTRPTIDYPPNMVHVFDPTTFGLGRRQVDADEGVFWITDAARSVVDAHRLRHRVGQDVAAQALRRYLARADRDLVTLMEIAKALRAGSSLRADLQVLLA